MMFRVLARELILIILLPVECAEFLCSDELRLPLLFILKFFINSVLDRERRVLLRKVLFF